MTECDGHPKTLRYWGLAPGWEKEEEQWQKLRSLPQCRKTKGVPVVVAAEAAAVAQQSETAVVTRLRCSFSVPNVWPECASNTYD